MIPKFRVFVKKENELFETDDLLLIDFLNEEVMLQQNSIIYATSFDFDEVILMQSTGLHDKNGKEIFEGDILEVTDKHSWLEVVSYSQEKAMFVTEEINREFKVPESPLYDLLDSTFLKFKVIGNIYENPELLEVE